MSLPFLKRLFPVLLILLFAALCIHLNDVEKPQLVNTQGRTFERATVTEILRDNLQENGSRIGDQVVRLQLEDGTSTEANCPNGLLFGTVCAPGMRVIVMASRAGELTSCTVYSYDRSFAVVGFLVFFCALLALVGGKRGAKSVLALMLTFACFLCFFFPLLMNGVAPVVAGVVTSCGLLFSGILFASLGAVLDIAMDVSAAVAELHATDAAKSRGELFASGMNVGRDVMGTMAATLILAVFGGSLGAFFINYVYDLPLLQLLNSNGLDIVLMQGLAGGTGVILTVPLAAGASAWLLKKSA